ncbi:hypothetical protein [Bradyrhizobium acaciae]|uniref:hypothetical protein n=1 Tax=Bradyrhizobium acaciae TaxID=2683706 RepID=UPI001E61E679|nr:hypothetical protein [Bradyrhizobium acaciae]MCC8977291.1 hypothetical protein [Bradyrhizobium acaciae]
MYDIYLNRSNELLVVARGGSIPSAIAGSWRKQKRVVRTVSHSIRHDVLQHGYHRRNLAKRLIASARAGLQ